VKDTFQDFPEASARDDGPSEAEGTSSEGSEGRAKPGADDHAPRGRGGPGGARDVRLIALGRGISFAGDLVAANALVLHAYDRGWGTPGVSAIMIAAGAPLVIGAPAAGRIVDRLDSRLLTLTAALWEGCCAALIALVLALSPGGPLAVAGILALIFAMGCGQAVSGPAWNALIPSAVPGDQVGRAVATVQSATSLAMIVGPALAGVLVGTWSVAAALWVDSASFGALLFIAACLRTRRRPDPADGSGVQGPWAGVIVLRRDPVLGPLVAGLMILVLSLHTVLVVEVFLVRGTLHGTAVDYGLISAALAVFLLVGSLLSGRIDSEAGRIRGIIGSMALVPCCVLAAGFAWSLPAFAVVMALVGAANGVLNVSLNSLVLLRVPEALRGRTLAVLVGGMQVCNLAGTAVGGPLGSLAAPRTIFVATGLLGVLTAAVVIFACRSLPTLGGTAPAGTAAPRDPG
jgi:MFS family permease